MKKRIPEYCPRCKAEFRGSAEDETRCDECFSPIIEPEYPTDDDEETE